MKQDNSERTLLYLDNGNECLFSNWTFNEAKKHLKVKGYKKAYSGRQGNQYGVKVLVGINSNNSVKLEERRKNGLYRALQINLS